MNKVRAARSRRVLPLVSAPVVFALLLAAPQYSEAWLVVSSDTWPADEAADNGDFYVYGRATARSDAGWVVATATLHSPSSVLDVAAAYGVSIARAEVSALANTSTFEEGAYVTVAQGEDGNEYVGCQLSEARLRIAVTFATNPSTFPPFCLYSTLACSSGTPTCAVGGIAFKVTPFFTCGQFARFQWLVVILGSSQSCIFGVAWDAGGPGPCT